MANGDFRGGAWGSGGDEGAEAEEYEEASTREKHRDLLFWQNSSIAGILRLSRG